MNPLLFEIKNLIILLKNTNLSEKQIEEIELQIFKKCFELKKINISL